MQTTSQPATALLPAGAVEFVTCLLVAACFLGACSLKDALRELMLHKQGVPSGETRTISSMYLKVHTVDGQASFTPGLQSECGSKTILWRVRGCRKISGSLSGHKELVWLLGCEMARCAGEDLNLGL